MKSKARRSFWRHKLQRVLTVAQPIWNVSPRLMRTKSKILYWIWERNGSTKTMNAMKQWSEKLAMRYLMSKLRKEWFQGFYIRITLSRSWQLLWPSSKKKFQNLKLRSRFLKICFNNSYKLNMTLISLDLRYWEMAFKLITLLRVKNSKSHKNHFRLIWKKHSKFSKFPLN